MLISILFITGKRQRIKSMAQACFRLWFSSYNSPLHELLYPIFINGKNSCKNIKQKHGTYSMINRLKIIYPGRGGEALIRKNYIMLTFQDNGSQTVVAGQNSITIIWELLRNVCSQAPL